MSYRVEVRRTLTERMKTWGLVGRHDYLLVDVYLRLERLRDNPALLLHRASSPFDGMLYEFSLIDPKDRLTEHIFVFLVVYSQDEQTLIVANGGYWRRAGM